MRKLLIFLFFISVAFNTHGVSVKVDVKGDPASIAKIMRVLPGLEKALNSPELKSRLSKATFTSTKLSSSQIVENLLINEWTLKLQFKLQKNWRGRCPVLGWTYPKSDVIYINSCGFEQRDDAGLAGTLAHEMSHKLGFSHKSAQDLQSVPYSFGSVVSELYGKTK